MSSARTGGKNRRLLTGTAWAALLLALWLCGHHTVDESTTSAPQTGATAAPHRTHARGLPPAIDPLPGAGPQGLAIKAMGLEAPIEAHGLDPRGGVETPPYSRPNAVSWYQDGPAPGSTGAAVLVGHVDTQQSPAVFYELSTIKRGVKITVTRKDGSVAEFTVEDVTVVDKDHWDDEKVYAPKDPERAELRLITCGGDYNRAKHEYTANVVVSAYLTGVGHTATAPKPSPAAPTEDGEEDESQSQSQTQARAQAQVRPRA
ncbi:class F sortase [Streptomyces sp. NPDC049585]|uniref:class F sortase n=1 Tax=Streptomyces sp. NPDC049585 TaxID=3155154 RepID=UPI00341623CF